MVYCNTTDILNSALTKVIDDSTELRAKALSWLNEVAADIFAQPRKWKFLEAEAVVVPTHDTLFPPGGGSVNLNYLHPLPNDFSELLSIEGTTTDFFYTKEDQIHPYDVYLNEDSTSETSIGFTYYENNIKFIPVDTVTESVLLKYEKMLVTPLADSTTDTIFPLIFKNLFLSGIRMHYYDYDKDGRYSKEVVLYENEMYKVKAWDNTLKTIPYNNRHGYLR